MNVFDKLIEAIGLDATHQGENGWLHAILKYGSATYTTGGAFGADVFTTNNVTECLRRLEIGGVGSPTLALIRHLLNSLSNEYERGSRKA